MLKVGFTAAALVVAGALHSPSAFGQAQEDLGFSTPSSVVQGSGARAFGMGGAFLARADDATAASWNPAGLSYLRRPEISVVGARRSFDLRTNGVSTGAFVRSEQSLGYTPDFVSAAWPIQVGSATGSVQAGYQRVISFEGRRTFEQIVSASNTASSDGASIPTLSFKADSGGGFDALSLGAGLRVTQRLRVGFTVNRWLNSFREVRERQGGRPSVQEVELGLSGWNVNGGVIVHPVESLNLAVVFKSPFTGDVTLTRRRTDRTVEGVEVRSAHSASNLTLDFPAALGFGASWRPLNRLTVSTDYTRSFWSKGRIYNFFVLPAAGGPPEVSDERYYPTLNPLSSDPQRDTEQWRLGVEYVLIGKRLRLPLRAGYFNDRQYFEAFGEKPRYDGYTLGAGLIVGPLLFDVAYVEEWGRHADPRWGPDTRADVKIRQLFTSLIFHFGRR
jgi:long-subunit fatty acid transport protein